MIKRLLILALILLGGYYLGYTTSGLKTSIQGVSFFLPGKLTIQEIEGSLLDYATFSNLSYYDQDIQVDIHQGTVVWSPRFLINLQVIINEITASKVNIKFLNNDNTSTSSRNPLAILKHFIIFKATISDISYADRGDPIKIQRITLKRNIDNVSDIKINAFDGEITGHISASLQDIIHWKGDLQIKHINLATIRPALEGTVSFNVKSHGSWDSQNLNNHRATLTIDHVIGQLENYPITGSLDASLENNHYTIHQAKLSTANTYIELQGAIDNNWNIQWSCRLDNVSQFIPKATGKLMTQGTIKGMRTNPIINMQLTAQQFKMQDAYIDSLDVSAGLNISKKSTLTFKANNIKYQDTKIRAVTGTITSLKQKDQSLLINISALDDQDNKLTGQVTLNEAFNKLTLAQPINGDLKLQLNQLVLVTLISDEITRPTGQFQTDVHISGLIEKPSLTASLTLTNGGFDIPRYGVKIRQINARGIMNQPNLVTLSGHFNAGSGKGNISGNINLEEYSLTTTITGVNLQTVDSREYQLTVNPTIKFTISPKGMALTGDINIPKARLLLNDFNSVVTLPDEVTFTDQKEAPSMPLNLDIDLAIALGKDIQIAYDNFEGNIAGKLTIKQFRGQAATGIGEIHVVKGSYRTYGRTMAASEGRLMYSGNALINPAILVRAQQEFKSQNIQQSGNSFTSDTGLQATYTGESMITAGVQIAGSINRPIISLYSIPSGLSHGDILSYLLFGHPQAQAQGQSAGAIMSLLSSMYTSDNSKIGGLTGSMKSFLDLSDLSVDSVDVFDPNTNSVVPTTTIGIGKQLGRDLYIRYQIGVFDPVSILNIRYQLTKRLFLQSETSPSDNGADLFYSIETD